MIIFLACGGNAMIIFSIILNYLNIYKKINLIIKIKIKLRYNKSLNMINTKILIIFIIFKKQRVKNKINVNCCKYTSKA